MRNSIRTIGVVVAALLAFGATASAQSRGGVGRGPRSTPVPRMTGVHRNARAFAPRFAPPCGWAAMPQFCGAPPNVAPPFPPFVIMGVGRNPLDDAARFVRESSARIADDVGRTMPAPNFQQGTPQNCVAPGAVNLDEVARRQMLEARLAQRAVIPGSVAGPAPRLIKAHEPSE